MDEIKLTNSQRDFLTSKALYPAFVGGRGAGKSFMMAYKCVLTVMKYNVDAWLCSPTEDQAKRVMMKNVDMILRKLGVKFSKTKVPPNINIHNGPNIRFVTLKNPDVLVGAEIGFIGFDEFDTVDMATAEEAWGKAGACLRQKCDVPGFIHQACVSTTPEGFVFVHKMWEKMANDSRTDLLKQMEAEKIDAKLNSAMRGYVNSTVALRRFGMMEEKDRSFHENESAICKKYIDSVKIPDYLSLKLRMALTGMSQYQLYRSPTEENLANLPDGYLEKLEEIEKQSDKETKK